MRTVVAYEQRDVADAKAFRGRILRVHLARDFCYGLLFTEGLMINCHSCYRWKIYEHILFYTGKC